MQMRVNDSISRSCGLFEAELGGNELVCEKADQSDLHSGKEGFWAAQRRTTPRVFSFSLIS